MVGIGVSHLPEFTLAAAAAYSADSNSPNSEDRLVGGPDVKFNGGASYAPEILGFKELLCDTSRIAIDVVFEVFGYCSSRLDRVGDGADCSPPSPGDKDSLE